VFPTKFNGSADGWADETIILKKSITNYHISADSHQDENQPQVSQNAEHGGDGEYPQS
jgi:hypothetical protein